jgi:hypothetical protein
MYIGNFRTSSNSDVMEHTRSNSRPTDPMEHLRNLLYPPDSTNNNVNSINYDENSTHNNADCTNYDEKSTNINDTNDGKNAEQGTTPTKTSSVKTADRSLLEPPKSQASMYYSEHADIISEGGTYIYPCYYLGVYACICMYACLYVCTYI